MSKKHLPVTTLVNELHGASAFFQQPETRNAESTKLEKTPPTQKFTQARDYPRGLSRKNQRESEASSAVALPTRDEIQEFSFRLRDEFKVKVQAEVPYQWQEELEDIARRSKVKKLELYRYVLGEFLGKVKREKAA